MVDDILDIVKCMPHLEGVHCLPNIDSDDSPVYHWYDSFYDDNGSDDFDICSS